MKKRTLFIINVFVLMAIFGSFSFAEEVQIKDIVSNPSIYNNEEVSVKGLVTQYVESQAKTTAYYLLKGDYGALIRVNTSEVKPKINWIYQVKGIVYVNESNQSAFISEKTKTILEYVEPMPGPTGPVKEIVEETWLEKNYLQIVIVGGGVLLILLLILLVTRRKSSSVGYSKSQKKSESQGSGQSSEPQSKTSEKTEYKTMVVPKASPKTMKFIPGELEVVKGLDNGKRIKIAGYPTSDGSIITIGRENVTGPRDYAHIELKERTISRKQAEIISRDGKIYIKNLSTTNYTKLDGVDIPPNNTLELKPNSIITLGEVEWKYIK